jgi:hypothetical protein
MKKEELIVGKSYRVKSKEWFDANKNENNKVVVDGAEFSEWFHCGKSMVLFEFCENLWRHENDVELSIKGEDGWWKSYYIPPFALEEDPKDKRQASKETLEFIEKMKAEKFLYGYDGGPGGGDGGTINTEKETIAPAFTLEGVEGIYIKVSRMRRTFPLENIRELFSKGRTETSFRASEWTTITTELKLIEDKTKLPERSSWSTMRD